MKCRLWPPLAMTSLRYLLVAVVLVAAVLVASPARASHGASDSNFDLSSWPDYSGLAPLETMLEAGAGIYVIGGTAAFLTLDAVYAAKKRPLPIGLAVTQTIYGGTLVAVGAALLASPDPAWGIGLLAIGGTVSAIPVAAFGVRVFRRPIKTAVHIQATGVRLTGTF